MSLSAEQRLVKTLRLAYLDYCLTPLQSIMDDLQCSRSFITDARKTVQYKEHFDELVKSWKEMMFALPNTGDLRRKISSNMSLAVTRIGEILATPSASAKDLIAAARLTAQMDGRFIASDPTDPGHSADRESLASELLNALKRGDTKVQ